MSNTIQVQLVKNDWIDASDDIKIGFITNSSGASIRAVESDIKPTVNFGHTVNPRDDLNFNLFGGQKLWIRGTNNSKLTVTPGAGISKDKFFTRDFLFDVNRGIVPGVKSFHISGRNLNVGTDEVDIRIEGGMLQPLTVASILSIVSDSADDDVAGSNARILRIKGLDAEFIEIQEDVDLNGLTSVNTILNFLRINEAEIISTGTYNVSNAGIITISVGANVQLIMVAGSSFVINPHYTIPAGKKGFLFNATLTVNGIRTAKIMLKSRGNSNLVSPPFDPVKIVHDWSGVTGESKQTLIHKALEKTDIWFSCISESVRTVVEADYNLVIVDDKSI